MELLHFWKVECRWALKAEKHKTAVRTTTPFSPCSPTDLGCTQTAPLHRRPETDSVWQKFQDVLLHVVGLCSLQAFYYSDPQSFAAEDMSHRLAVNAAAGFKLGVGQKKNRFPDISQYFAPDFLNRFFNKKIDFIFYWKIDLKNQEQSIGIYRGINFFLSIFLDFSWNHSITTTTTTARFFVEQFCIDAGKSILDY